MEKWYQTDTLPHIPNKTKTVNQLFYPFYGRIALWSMSYGAKMFAVNTSVHGKDATMKVPRISPQPCQPWWQVKSPHTFPHTTWWVWKSQLRISYKICCTPALSCPAYPPCWLWSDLRGHSLHTPRWVPVLALASARNAPPPCRALPPPVFAQVLSSQWGLPRGSCLKLFKTLYCQAPFSVLFFSRALTPSGVLYVLIINLVYFCLYASWKVLGVLIHCCTSVPEIVTGTQ